MNLSCETGEMGPGARVEKQLFLAVEKPSPR